MVRRPTRWQAAASLYDATSDPAWRLARCLSASDAEAEELVVRAYRDAMAAEDGEVPDGTSPVVFVLGFVRRAARRSGEPPLLPAA